MAKEVIMPALGMAQETGTLLAWLKNEGDAVTKGEPLMTIATDKTDVEIEANATGILTQVTAKVGDEVPVGQAIAMILTPTEMAASKATASMSGPAAVTQAPVAAATNGAVSATPVATRLAAEHHIDLSQIKAGNTGKIQKEDVLAYIASRDKAPMPSATGRIPASPKAKRLASEQNLDLAVIKGSGPDGAVLAADLLAAEQKSAILPLQTDRASGDVQRTNDRATSTERPTNYGLYDEPTLAHYGTTVTTKLDDNSPFLSGTRSQRQPVGALA